MIKEVAVLGSDNCISQNFWNVVIADDVSTLGLKFTDQFIVAVEDASDSSRGIVVQVFDFR